MTLLKLNQDRIPDNDLIRQGLKKKKVKLPSLYEII